MPAPGPESDETDDDGKLDRTTVLGIKKAYADPLTSRGPRTPAACLNVRGNLRFAEHVSNTSERDACAGLSGGPGMRLRQAVRLRSSLGNSQSMHSIEQGGTRQA